MTQNAKLLAMGLVGGYLLGRTRKAKIALAVASWVLGRRTGLNPQKLLTEGLKRLSASPEFSKLNDQLRGELMAAGRSLVTAAANRRLDSLSNALRDRTDSLSGLSGAAGKVTGDEPEDAEKGEEPDGEPDEQKEAEPEPEPEEEPEQEPEARRPARKAPAKKAPPKKAPAKKAPAKKSGSSAAKKTAGKKTAAKKAAAKKSAARKPASRSTRGR